MHARMVHAFLPGLRLLAPYSSAIVDADGREINSNRFIALMATISLREHPGTTIVTDSVTSNGLTSFIEARGGKHFRFKCVARGVRRGRTRSLACACAASLPCRRADCSHHQHACMCLSLCGARRELLPTTRLP